MKTLVVSSAALVISLLFQISASAQSLNHGAWKAKTQFILNGLPLPAKSDELCVTKENVQNLKEQLTSELSKNGCKLEQWSFKDPNLTAKLTCDQNELKAKGELKGKVTQDSYQLSGNAEGTYHGIPSVAKIILNGTRTGSCK